GDSRFPERPAQNHRWGCAPSRRRGPRERHDAAEREMPSEPDPPPSKRALRVAGQQIFRHARNYAGNRLSESRMSNRRGPGRSTWRVSVAEKTSRTITLREPREVK